MYTEGAERPQQHNITQQPQLGKPVPVLGSLEAVRDNLTDKATDLRLGGKYSRVDIVRDLATQDYVLQKIRPEDESIISGGKSDAEVIFENAFDEQGRMTSATIVRDMVTHTRTFMYDENNVVIGIDDMLKTPQMSEPVWVRQQRWVDGKPQVESFPATEADATLSALFTQISPNREYDLAPQLTDVDKLQSDMQSLFGKHEENGDIVISRPQLGESDLGNFLTFQVIRLREVNGRLLMIGKNYAYFEGSTDDSSMDLRSEGYIWDYTPEGTVAVENSFVCFTGNDTYRTVSQHYTVSPLPLADGSNLNVTTHVRANYYDLNNGLIGNDQVVNVKDYDFIKDVVFQTWSKVAGNIFGIGVSDAIVGTDGQPADYMTLVADDITGMPTYKINPLMVNYGANGELLEPAQPIVRTFYLPRTRSDSQHGPIVRSNLKLIPYELPDATVTLRIDQSQQPIFELVEPEV